MFTFLNRLLQSIINFFRGVAPAPAPTPPVVTINVLPVITLLRPTSDVTGDKVVIAYKLSDDESDPVDLNVSFNIAGGPSQVATADTQDSRHSGVNALATNPKNSSEIFYATKNTLYSTFDGGQNWITKPLATSRITSHLYVDPVETSILYLTVAAPL